MPTIQGSSDNAIHYTDSGGTDRPVVLIHGWPLSGKSWEENLPALLDAGYRVLTYDRRGFGDSDKPLTGYGYDDLADDLDALLIGLDLQDVSLVGFSMGGGEVARYVSRHGDARLHSVVFAAAVTPYLLQTDDNPDGPLPKTEAAKLTASLTLNQEKFYDGFTSDFFSANGQLMVSEEQRQAALALALQSSKAAALQTMTAWGTTDFREDLRKVTVPTLVIHGDADATVPYEGSGARTHAAIPGSEVHVIAGAPHGLNVSHREEFDRVLLEFLAK